MYSFIKTPFYILIELSGTCTKFTDALYLCFRLATKERKECVYNGLKCIFPFSDVSNNNIIDIYAIFERQKYKLVEL